MILEALVALLAALLAVGLAWLRVKTAAGSSLRKITGRILLITAHPDDECMFFAPTILSLGKSVRAELFLLCLSEGEWYIPEETTYRKSLALVTSENLKYFLMSGLALVQKVVCLLE